MSTILIIDDESFEFSALREALGNGRFDFESAVSGAEAREILTSKSEQIDAILLDWELPDVDGIQLLDWIKEQPDLGDIEVVVESAATASQDIRAGIDRGAYYYLTKPYEDVQLQAIVEAAVESRQLKRSLLEQVDEANDVLRLLDHGTFLVRTIREAEALAVRLAASCNDPAKGLGLFELLVNAIEHGNLGITYDDKSRLLEKGSLSVAIQERLELPENRDKRVVVELDREVDHLLLRLKDCGAGFDHRKYSKIDPERLFDAHGRGILAAKSCLDLQYVEPGNQVRVSVPYGRGTPSA